ncbi:glycosyltransferase family 2 protein [Candidatus Gottesmanbacteria bacterium]|nr:glycosyltransferase family 2 protein [Candidatus Gottesmanbacteria bacterium]
MKTPSVWFIIVSYRPDPVVLAQLRKSLEENQIIDIDNSRHNAGYGGGANKGIRRALAQGAEWVVILNQDIVISKKAAKELCLRISGLSPGIAGPWPGSLDEKRWTTIYPSDKLDYLSGACMAIHRSVFKKIGFFYAPYFMYYEDVDFCIRATRWGFPLHTLTIQGISHANQTVWRRGSPRHDLHLARNHLWFVWRLAPWRVKLYELVRLPKTIYDYWC